MISIRTIAILTLLTYPFSAWSEALSDPTRPLAETGEGVSVLAPRSTANTKGLLSVIISPERCAAIIDSKTFGLGDMYGGAQLIEISASGVLLQNKRGQQHFMALFPTVGVKMKSADSPSKTTVNCILEKEKISDKSQHKIKQKERK